MEQETQIITKEKVYLPKQRKQRILATNPYLAQRELNNRSLYEFIQCFWNEISSEEFKTNWHIPYVCKELEEIAYRVANKQSKKEDLIINIPPGTTKTIICSIMFPVWCWTKWYWMRFITLSYSATLSMESAEFSRDMIRSELFKTLYPDLQIKADKDNKSNYKLMKFTQGAGNGFKPTLLPGGNRYSTSVGGTLTGFHAHIIIWDDPLNPQQAVSPVELANTNRWMDQTLPTRKVDKKVSATIGIMQRLHQNDPTGHILSKKKGNVKHICLPAELDNYGHTLNPPSLASKYVDGLLDPNRMPRTVLVDLLADLGQYGYAGQMGQDPTPPQGGMFKVDMFTIIERMPPEVNIIKTVRFWDKAGTKEILTAGGSAPGQGARTAGVKMHLLDTGKWLISSVEKGRWAAVEREKKIKAVAEADGKKVIIYHEQEPGSGGKESAESTNTNLAGFTAIAERPVGDKIYRADPYSVQVNGGNVLLLRGDWNHEFIEEHRFFPFSTLKDQVDAAGAAFSKLTKARRAGPIGQSKK
jgi:predicted phage terminase large subunit-like protein